MSNAALIAYLSQLEQDALQKGKAKQAASFSKVCLLREIQGIGRGLISDLFRSSAL